MSDFDLSESKKKLSLLEKEYKSLCERNYFTVVRELSEQQNLVKSLKFIDKLKSRKAEYYILVSISTSLVDNIGQLFYASFTEKCSEFTLPYLKCYSGDYLNRDEHTTLMSDDINRIFDFFKDIPKVKFQPIETLKVISENINVFQNILNIIDEKNAKD